MDCVWSQDWSRAWIRDVTRAGLTWTSGLQLGDGGRQLRVLELVITIQGSKNPDPALALSLTSYGILSLDTNFSRVNFFFFMWTILKSLLNLLQHCFFFMSWCFGHESCVILASRPGIEPIFTTVEDEDLTIGLPGKCQRHSHINPILKKQSGNILPQSAFWQHVTKIQISEWFALRFYCGMRDTKTENSISVATGVYRDFCNVACWRQWSC